MVPGRVGVEGHDDSLTPVEVGVIDDLAGDVVVHGAGAEHGDGVES